MFDYLAVMQRLLSKNPFKTEREFAEFLDVVPNTFTKYKRGETSFQLHKIPEVCEKLGVTPLWLLFGVSDLEADSMAIYRRLRGKDAEKQREVAAMIDLMLGPASKS